MVMIIQKGKTFQVINRQRAICKKTKQEKYKNKDIIYLKQESKLLLSKKNTKTKIICLH